MSFGAVITEKVYMSKRSGGLGNEAEQGDIIPDVVTMEKFDSQPVCTQNDGTVASGTTGETNVMILPRTAFEYNIKGTQTILVPSIGATGLDVSMDATDNDGVEITQGITARSRAAFTVGTSGAFYAKLTFTLADVSDTDDCAFGFRKAEAYQANIDDYDEMACLNVISGDIYIETILNNAATVSTDTTNNWADAASHTLEVYVSATGVVTFKIDGAAPTVTATHTFDSAEVVVPFFFMLHAAASTAGAVLTQWEVGLQDA